MTAAAPASPPRKMRRDAQRRREALIRAAAECFHTSGYWVPLEEVAKHAGVGRGTLYRCFADRAALLIAVIEREMDQVGEAIAPLESPEDILPLVITQAARMTAFYSRAAIELARGGAVDPGFTALSNRAENFLAPIVAQAQRQGALRATISPRDLLLVVRMIGSLLDPAMSDDEVRLQSQQALALIMAGLRP
jgi:AcrR family transcriptional regulator